MVKEWSGSDRGIILQKKGEKEKKKLRGGGFYAVIINIMHSMPYLYANCRRHLAAPIDEGVDRSLVGEDINCVSSSSLRIELLFFKLLLVFSFFWFLPSLKEGSLFFDDGVVNSMAELVLMFVVVFVLVAGTVRDLAFVWAPFFGFFTCLPFCRTGVDMRTELLVCKIVRSGSFLSI